jgi:hypothetical protein
MRAHLIMFTRRLVWATVVCSALVAAGPGSASAETTSPWFSAVSVSLPGNLQAGAGVNEVQTLAVSATKGDWFFGELGELEEAYNVVERILPYNATQEEVQRQLEEIYPGRRVEVAGEGAGEGGKKTGPFKITYPDQRAPLLKAEGFPFELECGRLEKAGLGSCGGDPSKIFGPLEGGSSNQPQVAELQQGSSGDQILTEVVNIGSGTANLLLGEGGTPLQVVQTLPPELEATFIEASLPSRHEPGSEKSLPARVHCEVATLTCVLSEDAMPPFVDEVNVRVGVSVGPGASTGEDTGVTVSGGGAASTARGSHAIRVARAPGEATPFGVEGYEMHDEDARGAVDAQAGSHPFQTTFLLSLNETLENDETTEGIQTDDEAPAQLTKDLSFRLPTGWVADPSALPHCTLAQFYTFERNGNLCAGDTVVGISTVRISVGGGGFGAAQPIFNLEPAVGEPARFGFIAGVAPILIGSSVRTGGDYGVTARVENITQLAGFMDQTVTFWGVPGAASHNGLRGSGCIERTRVENDLEEKQENPCEPGPVKPPPLLTMPTTCGSESSVEGDSWAEADERRLHGLPPGQHLLLSDPMGTLGGCGDLLFAPEIKVTPDSEAASTPSGLNVDVHIPQEGALNGSGLASADVKNITVTNPEGVALNPSAGDGQEACPLLTGHGQEQAEEDGSISGIDLETPEPANCPNASKIATATVKTPLLPNPLKGFVYLAQPESFAAFTQGIPQNPFGTLVAMYLVVKDPVSGVLIKLAGQVSLGPEGQITATFAHNPPDPLEDAEIHFFGGERAPLGTPARCGAYTTTATFEPWSNGEGNTRMVHAGSTFDVTEGPNHTPCPGASLPFAPTLTAGTTSNQAGGFSPFTMTMSREDGEQSLSSIELHMPPGLSGTLSNVKLCGEAQANEGTCPQDTLIGETIVSVGLGGDPFSVKGGKVYLTEKYKGAPFGLSIVNPAKAGPFDLENTTRQHPACDCIVVRAKIQVDPVTAALTITSNPPGSQYSIPTSIEGIPLEIQHVNVTINHLEDFTFNPTNCNKLQITGTLFSTEGAADELSVPFQATNCAALGFKPQFAVSTRGKTSRTQGASLTAKLSYPNVGGHSVLATGLANIAKVKVELPRQLPSRLSTLQKACTERVFTANPAGCPAASRIGYATTTTPLLPEKLTGPAYFVSNGGTKFPELIVVLQGYGVTVDLHGETFISKAGITSSTFAAVPDVPVGTFELTLPEGPSSALGATTNLCKAKLVMPTLFVAQNGAEIHQNTPISVTGCPKTTQTTKKHKHKHKHK